MLVLTYRGEVAMREHKAMLDSALSRDAELTKKLLAQHVENGLIHCLEAMDEQELIPQR